MFFLPFWDFLPREGRGLATLETPPVSMYQKAELQDSQEYLSVFSFCHNCVLAFFQELEGVVIGRGRMPYEPKPPTQIRSNLI